MILLDTSRVRCGAFSEKNELVQEMSPAPIACYGTSGNRSEFFFFLEKARTLWYRRRKSRGADHLIHVPSDESFPVILSISLFPHGVPKRLGVLHFGLPVYGRRAFTRLTCGDKRGSHNVVGLPHFLL